MPARTNCLQSLIGTKLLKNLLTTQRIIADHAIHYNSKKQRKNKHFSVFPTSNTSTGTPPPFMRIALLEDDPPQAILIAHWLTEAGMTCVPFVTGAEFRKGISLQAIDLILLDWMLPDDDGVDILVWLRKTLGSRIPIMFTTTRAEESALVHALDRGADDYLIKPLRRAETLARIHALLRRGDNAKPLSVVTMGGITIDNDRHHITVNGASVDLTDRERDLALYMLRNHGRLLTRQELLENVWHTNPEVITRTVDTHISRLRLKLGLTPENGFELTTVYHKGYRLEYRSKIPSNPGEA
ncbi:MAG: response regulator transcription factor [Burkholderiales bacterium]